MTISLFVYLVCLLQFYIYLFHLNNNCILYNFFCVRVRVMVGV